MIGHVDHEYSSYSYYERILRTGVNIAFDRCDLQPFMPDTIRAALICSSRWTRSAPASANHPSSSATPPNPWCT